MSNAFSRPDQLSSGLRARILAVADELGYVGPDPVGRALARGTTGAVGVLLTDSLQEAFSDEIATTFLSAIAEELAPTGLALTLLTVSDRDDVVPARDVALDGALIYSCRPESTARDWLLRRKLPLVFVDQDPLPGISTVNVDDRGGARAAAEHVISLGHRSIAVVTQSVVGLAGFVAEPLSPRQSHPQNERMRGWLDALRPASISPLVMNVPETGVATMRDAVTTLLSHPSRPTAVLCFSDLVAFGVIDTATELGLDVPGDLSVVGFDDSPAAARRPPPLTTVRQDASAKGRAAATALIATIGRARASTKHRARHVMLPTELVERASTAPLPAARR